MAHRLENNEIIVKYIRDNVESTKDKDLVVEVARLAGKRVSLSSLRALRKKLGLRKMAGRGISKLALCKSPDVTPIA
jgi:hypothetical protein